MRINLGCDRLWITFWCETSHDQVLVKSLDMRGYLPRNALGYDDHMHFKLYPCELASRLRRLATSNHFSEEGRKEMEDMLFKAVLMVKGMLPETCYHATVEEDIPW